MSFKMFLYVEKKIKEPSISFLTLCNLRRPPFYSIYENQASCLSGKEAYESGGKGGGLRPFPQFWRKWTFSGNFYQNIRTIWRARWNLSSSQLNFVVNACRQRRKWHFGWENPGRLWPQTIRQRIFFGQNSPCLPKIFFAHTPLITEVPSNWMDPPTKRCFLRPWSTLQSSCIFEVGVKHTFPNPRQVLLCYFRFSFTASFCMFYILLCMSILDCQKSAIVYGDVYESRAIDSIFPNYKGQLWLVVAEPKLLWSRSRTYSSQYCIIKQEMPENCSGTFPC